MASIEVEAVLAKLSLDQKIDLLAGIDFWHTKAIPEHGIPSLRTSDGPNGVRSTKNFNGAPSACFPCGTALGSTWNQKLLRDAGRLMGREAIAKGAHILLGPCINMQRSPLGGRGFESISEDPVLAGLGAAALTAGIQETGVVATIKHFVTNDQEHERTAVNAIVMERALREIYLMPFMIAMREAYPKAFMTAYNKLNGTHVSENEKIIQSTLREEWGWKGVVMSDWFGTYGTSEAINAGLDLEMPGPTRWRGGLLAHSISSNKVPKHKLDDRVRNMLNLVNQCKESGVKENQKEGKLDTPETAALLRQLAAESIVLLKNERKILPLRKDRSVLLVGPNARTSVFCGGGSSAITPYYAVSPYDGVKAKLEAGTDILYAIGCYSHKELPLVSSQCTVSSDSGSKHGMIFRAYNDAPTRKDRAPADAINLTSTYCRLMDYKCEKLKSDLWYASVYGYFYAERDGEYEFGLCVFGTGKLYVNGEMVIDNETEQRQGSAFYGCGTVEERGVVKMQKGQTYRIKLDFGSAATTKIRAGSGTMRLTGGGFRLGGAWVLNMKDTIAEAVQMAKEVDQVIICAGLNQDWEGEGADRVDMKLPGEMDNMISAVADANRNTVVVNQTGTPVEMPWLLKVPGLLQAWYGGNETGNAIADVLFGDVNPSGRSSLSWPEKVKHNPAYFNYRSEGGRTLYGEDVYVGYRYYETIDRAVNFPFGYGLSYTTFELSDLQVTQTGNSQAADLSISVSVINTGKNDGQEVVQVYVSQSSPSVRRPPRELKGFGKVNVKAGDNESVTVKVPLKYAASYWDETRDSWILEKDSYEIEVTDGTGEVPSLRAAFAVEETSWWNGL